MKKGDKEKILNKLDGKITKEDLKLEGNYETNRNKVYNDYTILCRGKKIRVFRERTFDSEIGESGENFDFESDIELSDEDEEVIKEFIQDKD